MIKTLEKEGLHAISNNCSNAGLHFLTEMNKTQKWKDMIEIKVF